MNQFYQVFILSMIIFLGCTNIPNYKPDNKSKVQSLIPEEKMGSGFFLPLSFEEFNKYHIPLQTFDIYEPILKFGFGCSNQNQNALIISELTPDYPAFLSGMEIGDKISKINNISIDNIIQWNEAVKNIIQQYGINNLDIQLTIERGNNIIQKKVSPFIALLRKDLYYIQSELLKNREIRVAVNTSEISNPFAPEIEKVESWEKMIKGLLITNYESTLIELLPDVEIVDRGEMNKILEEQKLQLSGTVKSDQVSKIGELSGATHLALLSLARAPVQNGFMDTHTFRIIEIESGKIMSSLFFKKPPSY